MREVCAQSEAAGAIAAACRERSGTELGEAGDDSKTGVEARRWMKAAELKDVGDGSPPHAPSRPGLSQFPDRIHRAAGIRSWHPASSVRLARCHACLGRRRR